MNIALPLELWSEVNKHFTFAADFEYVFGFNYVLFYNAVDIRLYSVEWWDDWWIGKDLKRSNLA
jgi:hypothetical protein